MIRRTGRGILEAACRAGQTLRVLGQAARFVPAGIIGRRSSRSIVEQMYYCGVKALGVTTVVGLFTGMILALQGGIELKRVGQAGSIGIVVAASVCREMGPMLTAIIVTALVGSTIAAEIGTMKVSEEIDALQVMSIDPVRVLVMPRLVAMVLMTFVLTVWVDLVGIAGGGLVAYTQLGVPFHRYFDTARTTLEGRTFLGLLPKHVYTGLVKAIVFGTLISSVACVQGLTARGGALGVGRAVRRTVVVSILLILVLGYMMTSFFYR